MTRKVYVKPVAPGAGLLFGWIVLELTPWQSFLDDWRRYGFRIATENALVELGIRKLETDG